MTHLYTDAEIKLNFKSLWYCIKCWYGLS